MTDKSVLVWGAPGSVSDTRDFRTAFKESGNNFGNLLIGHAVRSKMTPVDLIEIEDISSPAEADELCSQVVIPAANFLWKGFDFGYMYDFLAKTRLPITMIGVGVQASSRLTTCLIHPNTLKLMRLVSERSAQIGARGFYTAEVLAGYGIHNVRVIGCPSLYSTRTPALHVDVSRLEKPEKVSINLSRRVCGHSFDRKRMRELENAILRFGISKEATFIAQDEFEEISVALDSTPLERSVSEYFDSVPAENLYRYFKDRTTYFSDAEIWAKHINSLDLSVGTRFHGNLIALANGVPALMVIHDSRTLELATLINMPSINILEVSSEELASPTFIEERSKSIDFSQFERTYSVLHRRFVAFLDENGLRHNMMRVDKQTHLAGDLLSTR